ncbi:AAA family ATPase [Aquabacterium sp.]|uniref:AAA family ATPase n=1 Tax=Aquabacterium sp. TaxID=1872578 RepID=UPI0035ADB25B
MITTLLLDDWKSYASSRLQIDAITVVIGTNASGKSNALDALAFLNRLSTGALLSYALQGDSNLAPLRGGVEWAARRPANSFSVGVVCQADDRLTEFHYVLGCSVHDGRCDVLSEELTRRRFKLTKGERKVETGKVRLLWTDPCELRSPTIVVRLYNGKSGTKRDLARAQPALFQLYGQKLPQDTDVGVNEVIRSLRDIFVLDPIPSHMRTYSPLADKLDSDARNIAGVIAAMPASQKAEIERVLSQYAAKLPERDIKRVYADPVGKFGSDAMLYCEEEWGGTENPPTVDARGMSDGTLRFLAILTALLTRPKGSLLVIEEVDNGLHPSRASMLLQMLKDVGATREVDVLATTHNPALLDAMGSRMVPFITVAHRDPTNGHSVLTPLEDLADLPRLLAQGSIGRLSSRGLIERSLQEQLPLEFADGVAAHE